MTVSKKIERNVRKSIVESLGIDDQTASRLNTQLLLAANEGHLRDEDQQRTSVRRASVFESEHLVSRRQTVVSTHHEEVAARRAKNFAKTLMYRLQRQQAREAFGAHKQALEDSEVAALRELRASYWTSAIASLLFHQVLAETCSHERAKRLMVRSLAPLILRAVLKRRRAVESEGILASHRFAKPSPCDLQRASQIMSKFPVEALEKLVERMKPVAYPARSCPFYKGERSQHCCLVFVQSGILVELPTKASSSVSGGQSAEACKDVERFSTGDVVGETQLLLGFDRRKTLRAETACVGLQVSHADLMFVITNFLQPSHRVDCLQAAKGLARAALAKQKKPSIDALRNAHPLLSLWSPPMLSSLQSVLQPHVSLANEVVLPDVMQSKKTFVFVSGDCLLEVNEKMKRTPQAASQTIFGLSGVVKFELMSTCGETWRLVTKEYSEFWVVSNEEIVALVTKSKLLQPSVALATARISSCFAAAATASSIANSLGTLLRTSNAFQNVSEKILLRICACLRPRVTADGEKLCIEGSQPKEAVVLYCGQLDVKNNKHEAEVVESSALCFAEVLAETVVSMSITSLGSAVVFCISRSELLDAISNGGRDFSAMYSTLERCELLTQGTSSGNVAGTAHIDRDKYSQEKTEALSKAREKSAKWAAEYRERHEKESGSEQRKQTTTTRERIEHYDNIETSFHRMKIENKIFASMGNQLYQYVRNPTQMERMDYFSDPLKLLAPKLEILKAPEAQKKTKNSEVISCEDNTTAVAGEPPPQNDFDCRLQQLTGLRKPNGKIFHYWCNSDAENATPQLSDLGVASMDLPLGEPSPHSVSSSVQATDRGTTADDCCCLTAPMPRDISSVFPPVHRCQPHSFRVEERRREMQKTVDQMQIHDTDGKLTQVLVRKAMFAAPPGLPPPRRFLRPPAPTHQTERGHVAPMTTTLHYVTNPFKHPDLFSVKQLVNDDGRNRIGRTLPRDLLQGPKDKFCVLTEDDLLVGVVQIKPLHGM